MPRDELSRTAAIAVLARIQLLKAQGHEPASVLARLEGTLSFYARVSLDTLTQWNGTEWLTQDESRARGFAVKVAK